MKRITICTDGTWNRPDQEDRGKHKPTNVVKSARGILPRASDGKSQIAYYHDGVGASWGIDKIAGGGFGVGLSANIVDAYQFLVLNYEPDDHIYLFGFSRGAYTARSLAGLINKLGLLPKDHAFYTPEAYTLYREQASEAQLEQFKSDHKTRDVPIKFIGVWDTVGALGIPIGLFKQFNSRYEFHEVVLTRNVEHAYQALAIDERRRPFSPSLWQRPEGSAQTLEQVWFAGVHSNVGGGYQKDGLANISLHWIKDKAHDLGLEFDETFLAHYRPWYKHELRDSMTLMYRILIPISRPIGMTERANESVHPSAIKRFEEVADYKPSNLADYLSR